jgi:hypothetical protein
MSGSFAGSKSVDDRRRRRLAADDSQTKSASSHAEPSPEKPLPARRPTGRFPLRRIVSRSHGKLACVAAIVLAATAGSLAVGLWPNATGGAYGPGVAAYVDLDEGRLPQTAAGLVLLAAGQLAWLIRWARARSMRDFRGRYRVWWWASLALIVAGFAQLTEASQAFAATAVWLTGQQPLGSDVVFRLLPALCAIVVLLPSLQRDMRNCRTSRGLLLCAVGTWFAAAAASLLPDVAADALKSLTPAVPVPVLATGLFLTSIATTFASLLFHARHVVYESVEPPDLPKRRKKIAKAVGESVAADDTSKRSARRSRESKSTKPAATKAAETSVAATIETAPQAAKTPAVKAPTAVTAPAKPVEAKPIEMKPVEAKPASRPVEPPKVASRASETPADDDWSDEDAAAVGKNGRNYRLDDAEDPLKGLSKRERRKQRKAQRDRERAET